MEAIRENTRERMERMSDLVAECENIVFDEAPVMMHSIDENGTLVKVNRRWQAALGYQLDEVVGRKATDFLTEESRAQALAETLPLFWEAGRAHSIGYGFIRKSGRVTDMLLDAVAIYDLQGQRIALAALRDLDDLIQWRQSGLTIKTLQGLLLVRKGLGRLLSTDGESQPSTLDEQSQHLDEGQMEDVLMLPWELVSVTQDVVANLRSLADLQEQRSREAQHLQRLMPLAETIETTLSDLTSEMEPPQD